MSMNVDIEDEVPPVKYRRRPVVNLQLEATKSLSMNELNARLSVALSSDSDFLRTETVVCLMRRAYREGSKRKGDLLLTALLNRCMKILRNNVSEKRYPDVETICEDILGDFAELVATDVSGNSSHLLDFYECTFNLKFKYFRIDCLRSLDEDVDNTMPLPKPQKVVSSDANDEIFEKISTTFQVPANQPGRLVLKRLLEAIDDLPPDQREAVVLVHVLGYQKGSSTDPNKITAATRCNCDERTIHNRLKRAAAALVSFKEELNDIH